MNNLPKLLISIGDLEISIIAGHIDEHNNFKLLEKLSFSYINLFSLFLVRTNKNDKN